MAGMSFEEQTHDRFEKLEDRMKHMEDRMSKHDTQYAVINTKLSAILWGLGIVGAAIIGMLVKFIFPW